MMCKGNVLQRCLLFWRQKADLRLEEDRMHDVYRVLFYYKHTLLVADGSIGGIHYHAILVFAVVEGGCVYW